MLGLGIDAQLPELFVQILHKCHNPRLDGTKVMVIHFLTLGRAGTEKGAPTKHQIFPCAVSLFVHKEIFLFRTDRGIGLGNILVAKEFDDAHRLAIERFFGTQERGLFIECLSAVRIEYGGDA